MKKLRVKLRVPETGDEARACGRNVVVDDVLFVCNRCGTLHRIDLLNKDGLCPNCLRQNKSGGDLLF